MAQLFNFFLHKISPYQRSCSQIPVRGGSEPSRSARCWRPREGRSGPFDRSASGGSLIDSAEGRRPLRDLEERPGVVECNPEYKKECLNSFFYFLRAQQNDEFVVRRFLLFYCYLFIFYLFNLIFEF